MNEKETAIIERIRSMMKEKGLTQAELADALATKQYNVSRMLSGRPFPSIVELEKIADRLDVSIYYLIGMERRSYREVSQKHIDLIDAYENSSPAVQGVIDKILDL